MKDFIRNEVLEKMKLAVLEGEEKEATSLAKQAIDEKMDLVTAMNNGFLAGIREAGELYAAGDYYLPELVCSADAMKAALGILEPEIKKLPGGIQSKGKVILATVQGDIHDIGKTIVGAMMTASGYDVLDLGADVKNETVIEKVREYHPKILGLSALLTTTMNEQKHIIDLLTDAGLRGSIRVIVGGAPASHDWVQRISADGYSDNAMDAVKLVDALVGKD
jgi:trimethylamine corrinoid protein